MIDKAPALLKNKMLYLLENYFSTKNVSDDQKRAAHYLKYALKKFNELNEYKSFKFRIDNSNEKLSEKGLKEGSSYTLEEILKATKLENL